jgi:hypothetical protein
MNLREFAHAMPKASFYLGAVATLGFPGTAQANTPFLNVVINLQPLQTWVSTAGASSLCITISYDKNGNRILQTVGNVTPGTTIWGSGTYGCFVWKP